MQDSISSSIRGGRGYCISSIQSVRYKLGAVIQSVTQWPRAFIQSLAFIIATGLWDLADLQSCYGTNSASSLLELSVNSLKEGHNRRFDLSWRKPFYEELVNLSCIGAYDKVG